MRTGPLVRSVAKLTLERRIDSTALRRSGENVYLLGLTGGPPGARRLFLGDYRNSAVRSFDVQSGRLDASDTFTAQSHDPVHDVAYCAELDALFVATRYENSKIRVRSFGRNNSKSDNDWSERDMIQQQHTENAKCVYLRVLRDATLFFGEGDSTGIYVCRVLSNLSMPHCVRVALPTDHWGFDVQLVDNERRLAAALTNGSVALFRVETDWTSLSGQAVLLSLVPLADARNPVFLEDTLLIGVPVGPTLMPWKFSGDVIQAISFSTNGGRLVRERQLITLNDQFRIICWCFAYGKLFAMIDKSRDILVFNSSDHQIN